MDNDGELGEEGEKGKREGVEVWDLENPTMAKEEGVTEGQRSQHHSAPESTALSFANSQH